MDKETYYFQIYEIIKKILNKSSRPFDLPTIKEEIRRETEAIRILLRKKGEEKIFAEEYVLLIATYLEIAIDNGDHNAFDFFREVFFDDFVHPPYGVGGYLGTFYALSLAGLHGLPELDLKKYFEKNYSMKRGFIFHLYFRSLIDAPLIVIGETGTGKEMLGKIIHTFSRRRQKAYQEINCAAIPEKMLESELFGYEKGAFTDANTRKLGLLELADGGTIFLDEVGHMSRPLQAKILKVIDEKKFFRLGGDKIIQIDVRFTAAVQPRSMGKILPDLLYRLGYPDIIAMPTLNETIKETGRIVIESTLESVLKKTMITQPYFTPAYWKSYYHETDTASRSLYDQLLPCPKKIDDKSLQILINHKYEGNYRELENILRSAIVSCFFSRRSYISPKDLNFLNNTELSQHYPDKVEETEAVSPNKKIKLINIIDYANERRSLIVEEKVKEILSQGGDIKSTLMSEGLPEKEYQNFWKKIKKITGKSIRDLRTSAFATAG